MRKHKTPYLGSVRFFKHVILTAVALMIAVPTALCVALMVENSMIRAQAAVSVSAPPTAEPQGPMDLDGPEPTPPEGVQTDVSLSEGQIPLAHEVPTWQDLYPEMRVSGAGRSTVNEPKTVYLSFDDGPSANTPEILKILDQYGVKATFFVVGKTDEQSKQWMRDIVNAGHTLGIHSYTHDYKSIYASTEAFLEDYNQMYELIHEATGIYPEISRFPGGSINGYNGANYRDMISELVRRGFVYFDWNVESGDAAETGLVPAGRIAENALSHVDTLRRAFVLMHDSASKTTTVQALPSIIEGYQNAGYTFAALTPEVVPVVYTYPN